MKTHVLDTLFDVIESRRGEAADVSYTARLLAEGTEKIVRKLAEENQETVIAALKKDKKELTHESADLLYHLLVLWADAGINPEEVYLELQKRTGQSGLEEKKNRTK